MEKILFAALFCLGCIATNAATYYISSSSGDDSRTPEQAQNPGTPWKSIGKLNFFFNNLKPGDAVLFKRNDVFYGGIVTAKAGNPTAPIVLGAYGTGAKPVISGFTTAAGWTPIGKGIYESNALSTGSEVNMVVINGREYAMGRYPNENATNAGYFNFESHTTNTITDNDQTFDQGWDGAEVAIRTTHWNIDRGIISAVNGGEITVSPGSLSKFMYPIGHEGDNYGFFFQNSPRTLDQFGEWYYNPSTHKLQVYFGDNNPSRYTVQVSSIDTLFQARGSYYTIKDIAFTGANKYAVFNNWPGVGNQQYLNCSFSFNGVDGVFFALKTNLKIDNCVFDHNNSNAIYVGYHNENITISNCTITNTGILQGMLKPDEGRRMGFAIYSNTLAGAAGLTCTNNQIIKTGYSAISFEGDNNLIQNNFIDSVCLILDDGAGIYTGTFTPKGKTPVVNVNNRVLDNIVDHSLGAPLGAGRVDNRAHGYYLDDNANHITLKGNTGCNAGSSGLFIHNANNYTVLDNVFYNNARAQIYWQHDNMGGPVTNGIVKRNKLIAKAPSQKLLSLQSKDNNFNEFADLDSNSYVAPFNNPVVYMNWFKNSEQNYTFAQWKSMFKKDQNTKQVPISDKDADDVILKYNKTASPQTLGVSGSTYSGLDSGSNESNGTVRPFRSVIMVKKKR